MTVDLFSNFHFQVPISYKILKSGKFQAYYSVTNK